jgi:dTDP-glucose 4,6-dehydratase/GDP-L-fucose synthase
LIELIAAHTDFDGEIEWDTSKPDGQPRRRLDVSRAKEAFEWEAETEFVDGLKETISWYEENKDIV